MPRYHVRCTPDNGKPVVYLTRDVTDTHDGPYTDRFEARLTFARPNGADKRIAREELRQPNARYGYVQFEVVEEAEPSVCRHCGKIITQEGRDWLDPEGNDCCPFGFVPVRHTPKE